MDVPVGIHLTQIYETTDALLVFPSEVSAYAWRRYLARSVTGGAVRTDRLVSWDRFKEAVVPVSRDERPASGLIRRAFAHRLLRDHAAQPFLTVIATSEYAANAVGAAAAVARTLPVVPTLLARADHLRPALVADLTTIRDRYQQFLDDHRLFEPAWHIVTDGDLALPERQPVVVWPELLEDWIDIGPVLAPYVQTISLPAAATPHASGSGVQIGSGIPVLALQYDSVDDEVAAALERVETALADGVLPDDIAITVSDLTEARPVLRAEAARRGIPLRFAAGDPVLREPGGRLFQRIDEVLRSDLSVTALAPLLHDRSIPWHHHWRYRLLVTIGYRTHCYTDARWREVFALVRGVYAETDGDDQDAASIAAEIGVTRKQIELVEQLYHRLAADLRAIAGAADIGALARAIRRFRRRHLAPPGDPSWTIGDGGRAERIFETAMTELATIERIADRGIPIDGAWRFFLETLGEHQYVERGSGGAVSVFPYRVAAGNPVAVHLVLGLSQNATRVRSATPVAVRRNELWAMEWSHRDRSRAFFSAYTALWPNTTCSVSATGPRGARVPAAEIATQRAERPASLWDFERVWWRDRDAPLPAALYAPQERGLTRARATTLVPVTANAQREPIPLAAVGAHVRRAETLSPSAIDRYLACPFSFLVQDLLHVREGQWGYDPDPRREIGTALHDIMADLMQRPIGERLEAIEAVSETHLGSNIVRLRVPESVRRGWLSYAPRVIRALLANPAFEAERPSSTESDVSARIGSVTLAGIADRIAGLGTADPVSIYDYKLTLGDHHRASRVLGAGDPGMAASLQLPLYATMVASQYGVEVDRLAWVDLTNATVRVAADGDASRLTSNERTRLTRQFDQLQQLTAAMPDWLEEMDRRISAGELYCRDERPCDRCRIRSICRSCFVTRRYGDHR